MLDATLKMQLAAYMQRISSPVEIAATLDDTPASAKMRELLKDIAESSPLVKVTETPGGAVRTPSFSVNRPGEANGPRFAGLPMGHEFTSLVLALLQVGGYPPKVDEAVLRQIRGIGAPNGGAVPAEGDFEFEIYISLT